METTSAKRHETGARGLTHERLLELLEYDAETGVFRWKAARSRGGWVGSGRDAGCMPRKDGRCRLAVDGKRYYAHVLAWFYVTGRWPSGQIDHKNGNPADNRFINLRDVSNVVNMQNQRRARSDNQSTGLLGCSIDKATGRCSAKIKVDGSKKHLGYFDTPVEAHEVYLNAKRVLHEGCTL